MIFLKSRTQNSHEFILNNRYLIAISKLVCFCVVGCIIIVRSWMRFVHPQLIAEDGNTYFQDAYNYSVVQSVFLPYRRGFYFITRTVSEFVLLFRFDLIPSIFVFFCIVFSTCCCAFFVFRNFNHIIQSIFWRILVVFMIVLVPAMPEISLTITNVHWYLGILCFFLVMIYLPDVIWVQILLGLCWFILFLSAPQLVIFVPCLLVRALFEKNSRLGFVLGFICAVVVSFAILLQPSGDSVALVASDISLLPLGVVNGILLRVLAVGLFGKALSLEWLWHSGLSYFVYAFSIPLFVVNYLVFRYFLMQKNKKRLLMQIYVNYCIIAPIVLTLVGRPTLIPQSVSILTFWDGDRYFVLPIAALYFGVVWCVMTWWHANKFVPAISVIIAAIFCVGALRDLASSSRSGEIDFQWQQQVYRIYAAEAQPTDKVVRIPSAPDQRWSLALYPSVPFLPSLKTLAVRDLSVLGAFDTATRWTEQTDFPLLYMSGWADPTSCSNQTCEVIVTDVEAQKVIARTYIASYRADVAQAVGRTDLTYSGWRVVIPEGDLGKGLRTLRAYIYDAKRASVSPISGDQTITIE